MPEFNGRISLDIRDSEPDWAPYLPPKAPEGAPNILLLAWDELGDIVTQPGDFCLVGDGICVGRDSASPVTPNYTAPFRFTGGTIDKVVVDVSGEAFVDAEAKVMSWFAKD